MSLSEDCGDTAVSVRRWPGSTCQLGPCATGTSPHSRTTWGTLQRARWGWPGSTRWDPSDCCAAQCRLKQGTARPWSGWWQSDDIGHGLWKEKKMVWMKSIYSSIHPPPAITYPEVGNHRGHTMWDPDLCSCMVPDCSRVPVWLWERCVTPLCNPEATVLSAGPPSSVLINLPFLPSSKHSYINDAWMLADFELIILVVPHFTLLWRYLYRCFYISLWFYLLLLYYLFSY